jgi:hypothetical protein
VSVTYYSCERLRALVYDPSPTLIALVRNDADLATVARQLRRLADEIERSVLVISPAQIVSDDGPGMTAYVAEGSEALETLKIADIEP